MKKGFSILLALVMVLSVFAVIPFSVSAEESNISEVSANIDIVATGKPTILWPCDSCRTWTTYNGHRAIDIPATAGSSIRAAYSGTVSNKYTCSHNTYYWDDQFPSCCHGHGTGLVILGDDGRYYDYAHMIYGSIPSNINVGTRVTIGQEIGKVGDTGCAKGAHLHFSIYADIKFNNYLGAEPENQPYIYNLTPTNPEFTINEVSNITETNAYISCSNITNPNNGVMTRVGFQMGTSSKSYNINKYDDLNNWTYSRIDCNYRMSDVGVTLTPGTKYYYRFYIIIGGSTYNSEEKSFTTAGKVFEPIILGNDFVATITNSKAGMNIGANSEGNVELQTKSDSDNQKWHFVRQADNTYRITNVGYNKCMDVSGANTASGTNIQLWSENTSDAQRFYIRDAGYGYALVPLVNTSLAIDIYNGSLTNGTNIQDYTWNGTVAQIFSIDYVELKPPIYRDYNGHTYEFYNIQVPWNQAYRFCENKGGHLVTISDDAENFAVYELCGGSIGAIWIGATDFNREGNWYWVTGEPLSYNAWYPGEPNNTGSAENYGMMYIDAGTLGDSSTVGTIRKWNDTKLSFVPNVSYTVGFVCEYDNGDVNADSYTPVATETIDGITYSIFDYCVDWQTAEEICEAKGGQLVKIDSAEENNTVVQLMEKGSKSEYWINATDRFGEGTWTDSEGNALSYFNWVDGNPDNDFNAEQFVMISKGTGKWGDLKGFSPYYRGTGFICESRVPTGITLNKEELSLMIGDTSTLKATVTPTGVDDTVTWKSSNTKVATVTKSGKITGKSEGYSFVTATTVNGLEATCIVLVGGSRNYILGDTDEDGEVTIIDATCIQRHLASIPTAIYNEKASDADEDGEVTIIDATSIQRMLAELPHNNNIGKTFSGGSLPRLSDWTDWSTTIPTGNTIVESESRTEYRYKDKKEYREATQPATPEGYKLVFSDYCGLYSDWSAWSGWSTSRLNADGTLKQEGTTTGYRYYAFVCPNCGNRDPYNIPGNNNCSKCGYGGALNWNELYYETIGANAPSSTSYDSNKGYVTIDGQRWYFEKPGKDNGAGGTGQPTTTMYRYRTRSELIYYLFEQIDFCNWQTDAVTASDTRTVETRTVYRYRYIIM